MQIFPIGLIILIYFLRKFLVRYSFYNQTRGAIHRGHGHLLRFFKCTKAALSLYGEAIALAPGDWRNYAARANQLFLLNRNLEALEDIEAALSLNKTNPDLYEMRGVLYMTRREPEKALSDFNRLAAGWPRRKETFYLRSAAFKDLGKFKEALADLEADLKLNPHREDSLLGKAQCQLELEQYEAAAETAALGLK